MQTAFIISFRYFYTFHVRQKSYSLHVEILLRFFNKEVMANYFNLMYANVDIDVVYTLLFLFPNLQCLCRPCFLKLLFIEINASCPLFVHSFLNRNEKYACYIKFYFNLTAI
jgi:hypothetical protein